MLLPVIFSNSFGFCLLIISTSSTFHCSLVKLVISSFLFSLLAWLLHDPPVFKIGCLILWLDMCSIDESPFPLSTKWDLHCSCPFVVIFTAQLDLRDYVSRVVTRVEIIWRVGLLSTSFFVLWFGCHGCAPLPLFCGCWITKFSALIPWRNILFNLFYFSIVEIHIYTILVESYTFFPNLTSYNYIPNYRQNWYYRIC